ncbi:MAG: phage baseplate assembly protein V [Prevotella sp.]|nr:phage baseplate assembly protein V [Prevotella sp.]
MVILNIEDVCEIRLTDGGTISGTTSANEWFGSMVVSLDTLSYKKEMYRPGRLEMVLCLGAHDADMLAIVQLFKGKKTDYFDDYDDSQIENIGIQKAVCLNYYIFEVYPQYIGRALTVRLVAYSPDKYLTMKKYSKAYTGRRLVQDILVEELQHFVFPPDIVQEGECIVKSKIYDKDNKTWKDENRILTKCMNVTVDSAIGELRHLSYAVTINSGNVKKECMLPYLVQYNESFHDFLVRTANRCGEYLYYENGTFHLGLPATTTIQDILRDRVESISVNYVEVGDGSISTNQRSYNYCNEDSSKYVNDRSYNPEVWDDDYASPLPSSVIKGKDDNMEFDYVVFNDDYVGARDWISMAWSALNQPNIKSMVTSVVAEIAKMEVSIENIIIKKANKSYKEKYLEVNANIPPDILEERDKGKYLYSSKQLLTGSAFYKNMLDKEIMAESQSICIDMESKSSYPLLLGDTVTYNAKPYTVVEAEGTITVQSNAMVRSRKYIVIPFVEDANEVKPYPPLVGRDSICRSTAQSAFVVENKDPLRMNRVRIRYPWQADGEDASPWIRMALPMATEYGGFNFIPEVDDEVMVDFENGNVERPYVVGALYNTGHRPKDYYNEPTDYSGLNGETRSITSRNGHRIIFSDPSSAARFFDSFFPMGSVLGPLVGTFGNRLDLTGDEQKKLAGGIELTDEYGMYSIKMSSHARNITIDSPFGTVNMNAFKGISINAPNGEVSIKGKNISIEAGNNLTLKSGANIAKGWILDKPKSDWDNATSYTSSVMDLLKAGVNIIPVDLALMRCVLEAIIRPVGGTMLIKSHRYMCLEAGKGKTAIKKERTVRDAGTLLSSVAGTFTGGVVDLKETDKERARQMILNIPRFIDALKQAYITDWQYHVDQGQTYEEKRVQANGALETYGNANGRPALPDTDTKWNDKIGGGKDFEDVVNYMSNNMLTNRDINLNAGTEVEGYNKYLEAMSIAIEIRNHAMNHTMQKIYENTLGTQDEITREFLDYNLQCSAGNTNLPNHVFFQNIHRVTTTQPGSFDANKDMSMNVKKELTGCALNVIYKKITGNTDEAFQIPINDNTAWNNGVEKFIDAVAPVTPEAGTAKKIGLAVANSLSAPVDGFLDQNVWGNADAGDLLISTKEKTTMHVANKSIDEYVRNDERTDWLKIKNELLRITL